VRAAAGQAKLTGQLGVCAGTAGPGSNHLVAGFYEARRDRRAGPVGDIPRPPSPAGNGVADFSPNLQRHAADLPS
jgi:hypothetical protein